MRHHVAIGIDADTEAVLDEMVSIGIWGETIDEVARYLVVRGLDDLLRSAGLGPELRAALERQRQAAGGHNRKE